MLLGFSKEDANMSSSLRDWIRLSTHRWFGEHISVEFRTPPGTLHLPIPKAHLSDGIGGRTIKIVDRPPLAPSISEGTQFSFVEIEGGSRRRGLQAAALTVGVDVLPGASAPGDCVADYLDNVNTIVHDELGKSLRSQLLEHPAVSTAAIQGGTALRISSTELDFEPGNTTDYFIFRSAELSVVIRLHPTHFLQLEWHLIEWT